MDESLEQRIREFLADELRIPLNRIRPESRLAEDFGVAGDTAVELFEAFACRFEVNLDGLNISYYFGGEGCGCLFLLPFLVFILSPEYRDDYVPVTVAHLVRVAETKHWFAPEKSRQTGL